MKEKKKILYVEDDPVDRMAAKRLFRGAESPGKLTLADSLAEAEKLLRERDFTLVILDYHLPDGDAFQLFSKVKGAPVIIVTGIGDEEVAVRAMKAGAYDYVIKDSEGSYLKTLPVTIDNVLKRYQSERELARYREQLEILVRVRTEDLQKEIEERKRAEEQVRASLQEKELLIREVHHRVRNNMQIVSGLLSLQAARAADEGSAEAIRQSESRIRSMALLHENFYESEDLSCVDFKIYIDHLLEHLMNCYGVDPSSVAIDLDLDDVRLPITQAIPCAQIINELVSNSLKYAFPGGRRGRIEISLSRLGKGYRLTVSDDGIGFRREESTSSLGLELAEALAAQLKGNMALEKREGTTFTLDFGT